MSDDEDEVDLAAVERVAAAQLAKDLAAAKKRNERIAQKKQERADLLRKQKSNFCEYAYVFPLEAKRDPCSRMKITKTGQDQLLCHRIDQCFD